MSISRNLPVLQTVALRYFSLYRNQRRISADIGPGVFCLAGANGLGKSTFLAAINFGFTGIVASSARAFQSVNDYYENSITSSRQYFDGVIDEEDRDRAHVELTFALGNRTYKLVRNLFTPKELDLLEISDTNSLIFSGEGLTGEERHNEYANNIAHDCRVGSFAYFVFLQHFVLTFDERRDLLFWNDRTANAALYLAFGLDPEDAVRAEGLRHAINAADSNARNAQWQATLARRRLDKLWPEDMIDLEQVRARYDSLVARFEAAQEEADRAAQAASDARLSLAEESSRQLSLRIKYDEIFSARLSSHPQPQYHPIVARIMSDELCEVCGTEGDAVSLAVTEMLDAGRCPLCKSELKEGRTAPEFEVLESLDGQLAESNEIVRTAQQRFQRLDEEAKLLAKDVAAAGEALAEFEESHREAIGQLESISESDVHQRRAIEEEHRAATARRDDFRKRRDQLRSELEPLQAELLSAYQTGEVDFVPRFRRLAKRFIGLDLDVHLETERDVLKLSLEVQGSRRRTTTSLSESQRFFLEIALRMTLLQHMASLESPGALYIDTPEGSLDISYEARAGDMFAAFVNDGFNIVMTANINTSQLLLRLAERCGSSKMQLLRMTEWTPLSEVQAEEENLFVLAYRAIEEKLYSGKTATPGNDA